MYILTKIPRFYLHKDTSQLIIEAISPSRTFIAFTKFLCSFTVSWTLNPSESETIIKHALKLGINFFDTTNCYSAGTSEEYLGKAIRNNVSRDKVVIATKVYFNEGNLSKEAIPRELDGSLKRLGTDYFHLITDAGWFKTMIDKCIRIKKKLK